MEAFLTALNTLTMPAAVALCGIAIAVAIVIAALIWESAK